MRSALETRTTDWDARQSRMAEMDISARASGGIWIVTLRGELDAENAPRLRALLENLIAAERPRLRVRMDELTYLDSVGVGVLVAALKQAADRAGTMTLSGPTGAVARVLRVTGLDKVFPIFAEESSAAAALRVSE